ncbi:MAG: rhamnulokinase [Treponema sp.]|nr:rhamnulokinase [Treponema sp.]
MAEYYLAIDFGASGGRHILGHAENGKMILEEVHRFAHVPVKQDNSLVWDDEEMFRQITEGLVKCGRLGKAPVSVGIDTWGVDYALVDGDGRPIKPVYAYRDSRTEPFINNSVLPYEKLYEITGIATQPFNTVYQMQADRAAGRLEKAALMFQLPEYFSARLTGNLKSKENNEYTMASTTGLLDAKNKVWAKEVFEKLNLPLRLFKPIRIPPYEIGELDNEIKKITGFNTKVVMVASHDTASAVAVTSGDTLYISSGTWSLLGVVGDPVLTPEARRAGYTNEGAWNGKIRFLKNIMGLWVIQSVRHELDDKYSFAELESMARTAGKTAEKSWTIDVNLPRFYNPASMITEIKEEYKRVGKKVPQTPGELAFCVYTSLAQCYKTAIADLENITGKKYRSISIIGGGSKDGYLNALTAEFTGKTVFTGPTEATATGNILLQMKQAGNPAVKNGFSELVNNSFDIREIKP